MQRGASIALAELVEHLFDERRFEHGIGRANADAGVRESQLHFPPVDRIEHARDVALLHELPHGDRHGGRRDAHVIGEIAQHHRPLGVEVVHDAHLSSAHPDAALGVADVSPVAGEVDAGIVAKDARDVVGKAHAERICRNS